MFTPEATIWTTYPAGNTTSDPTSPTLNLTAQSIPLPLLSPLFPSVYCDPTSTICQIITGEGEINAAVTLSALLLSNQFDLRKTYILIAGIAGVSPEKGTLGSVAFSRYAVQVALQYEIDAREMVGGRGGYVAQGAKEVGEYPGSLYGTEVFELNDALRGVAAGFARKAVLSDSEKAKVYRARYATNSSVEEGGLGKGLYAEGTKPPSVLECDVATSDTYFSGKLLGEAFATYTKLLTNGTGTYCMTAQEDNSTLEALLRGHLAGLVDFARIVVMRTASDMDRQYPGQSAEENLFAFDEQGGFTPAIQNLYIAGIEVVRGILGAWEERFEVGIPAGNYVGDILGSIGGTPDFGPGVRTRKRRVGTRGVGYS
ncbi:purine nucleoside permease [Periconia macrospinosa]|uniref:Purine nucleoside permease n=1 Tax=Periconia macrospinosa TaxID=97972 RepID=A0A2V1DU27_9PLEO|nr:purine nucleoside permease [Periconia macrospinosa]